MNRAVSIRTTEGDFIALFSEHGLARIEFPRSERHSRKPAAAPLPDKQLRWRRLTESALRAALAGRKPVALPPLDWGDATEFQRGIWQAMLRIPPGRTQSYAELAASAGRPRAVRAAGGACGANPIPVLVPCHRVLAAGGRLGGFSSGLDWKRRLLALEGTPLGGKHSSGPGLQQRA